MKFALLLLIPILAQSQQLPFTGEIHGDSNFVCRDWLQSDSEVFDVKEICNTENQIEIRLKTSIMATTELIILSYNNDKWVAEKYYPEYITKKRKIISTIITKRTRQDSTVYFARLFDSLRLQNLFLIPDQKDLVKKNNNVLAVVDGALYTITFKVNSQFRRYRYGNPDIYKKYYPNIPEYDRIINIVRLLNNIFM